MWPFRREKHFFSQEENDLIVQAIRDAERQTSGEIRIFVESRCRYVDALDRAVQIFSKLQMEKTELRNGVLFYVALDDRQLAIYADTGIHEATGHAYWQNTVKNLLSEFSEHHIVSGITATIGAIGEALKTHFPYDGEVDKNELPDEIIFSA